MSDLAALHAEMIRHPTPHSAEPLPAPPGDGSRNRCSVYSPCTPRSVAGVVLGGVREWVARTVVGRAVMRIAMMLTPAGPGRGQHNQTGVDGQWSQVAAHATSLASAERTLQGDDPRRRNIIKAVVDRVEALRHRVVAAIPWARVLLRGSLIQGWKGPKKTVPENIDWSRQVAVRFNLNDFDADLSIELPTLVWQRELIRSGIVTVEERFAELDERVKWSRWSLSVALFNIKDELAMRLGEIGGYRRVSGKPDVTIHLEPTYWQPPVNLTGRTEEFVAEGLIYPPRAFTNAASPQVGLDEGARRQQLRPGLDIGAGGRMGVRAPAPIREI